MKLVISKKSGNLSVSMWTDEEFKKSVDTIQGMHVTFWEDTTFETENDSFEYSSAQEVMNDLTVSDVDDIEQARLVEMFGTNDFVNIGEENLLNCVLREADNFTPPEEDYEDDEEDDAIFDSDDEDDGY